MSSSQLLDKVQNVVILLYPHKSTLIKERGEFLLDFIIKHEEVVILISNGMREESLVVDRSSSEALLMCDEARVTKGNFAHFSYLVEHNKENSVITVHQHSWLASAFMSIP